MESSKLKIGLSIIILTLLLLIFPAVSYADCVGRNWSDTVVSWFTGGASWRTNYVTTNCYQRWGAPYCYVRDRHKLYKWYNGEWYFLASRHWHDYDELDGFDHVWEYHEHEFSISPGANYKAVLDGYRIANHASLLPHYQDIDTIVRERY